MTVLNIDAKFEGKMTCTFENDMRNLANFSQSTFESLKIGLLLGLFSQRRKCISLKFTGDLCVTTMKNDVKFEQELTGQFKTNMKNLTIFESSTQKSQ